jgi:hypothetical protein
MTRNELMEMPPKVRKKVRSLIILKLVQNRTINKKDALIAKLEKENRLQSQKLTKVKKALKSN